MSIKTSSQTSSWLPTIIFAPTHPLAPINPFSSYLHPLLPSSCLGSHLPTANPGSIRRYFFQPQNLLSSIIPAPIHHSCSNSQLCYSSSLLLTFVSPAPNYHLLPLFPCSPSSPLLPFVSPASNYHLLPIHIHPCSSSSPLLPFISPTPNHSQLPTTTSSQLPLLPTTPSSQLLPASNYPTAPNYHQLPTTPASNHSLLPNSPSSQLLPEFMFI